jgi:hypothetical protein
MDWQPAISKEDGTGYIPSRWLHLHYYEALNILFRMENALRAFVYIVLKNKLKEKWAEASLRTVEDEASTIARIASKRVNQARGHGYLGYEISAPLMYLNSGELTQIITSDLYWSLFRPYFRGKKEIIKTKLDEIGTVRNALAHFRPLRADDVELIKHNVKHVFVGIEQCLTEIMQTYRVVPTNTADQWYKRIAPIKGRLCAVKLLQDASQKWVNVDLVYTSLIINEHSSGRYRDFSVTNLITPAIITLLPGFARHCVFVTEAEPYGRFTSANEPVFSKRISFAFSRETLEVDYIEISEQMTSLLEKIDAESELIKQDNLARGDLVDSAQIWCVLKGDAERSWWSIDRNEMKAKLDESGPAEYWGEMISSRDDFIAGSCRYPWMPTEISNNDEIPF